MNLSDDRMEENSKSKTSLCSKTVDLHEMPRTSSPDLSIMAVKSENSKLFNLPNLTDEAMTSEVR